MKRYIVANGKRYLIRGPYTATQLKQIYKNYCEKYGNTELSHWLVTRGKVYKEIKK